MRAKIKGLEKLPKKGPFIIAGNHVSYFDPPTVYGMLPYRLTRRIFSMSLPEIFENFPLNILRKPVRIIMTGTQDTMMESLRYSRIVLKTGESMIIFPEGKRSVDGRVDKPKHGVFMLAQECNAPLVPVYLKGFTKLYSRLNPGFHFAKLEAEVLDPIPVEENIEEAMDQWRAVMKEKNDEEFKSPDL
jgi:1-acyl-sn-glycerol-3-phosphate acyltransferase